MPAIGMQDEVTIQRLVIVPLKGWMNSNILEQFKILFRKKIRAD
jgi:hypothetical protein